MVLGFGNKRMISERELLILYSSRKGADGQLKPKSVMLLKHSDDCLRFQTYLCYREEVNKCNDIGYL